MTIRFSKQKYVQLDIFLIIYKTWKKPLTIKSKYLKFNKI